MTAPRSFGFIGLGLMGFPMACNLARSLNASGKLYAFDLVSSTMDRLSELFPEKVVKASSATHVAAQSDVIFTMLPEGRHVKSVYIDRKYSLSATDLSGKLLIDCSTIDTTTSLAIKESLTKLHPSALFYDAPVSGGTIGAEKGTISFFVGTTEDDPALPRIQSILSSMGKQIIPCGGPSLGLTAKLCNNYLTGILNIANSEVFNIGMRAGLDPRLLYKVIGAGSSQNTICDKFCPVPNVDPDSPSSHGYRGGFRVPLMLKDFTLAMNMARQVGASTEIGQVGWRTYDALAKVEEMRDLDVRVIFRHIGGDEQWDKELGSS